MALLAAAGLGQKAPPALPASPHQPYPQSPHARPYPQQLNPPCPRRPGPLRSPNPQAPTTRSTSGSARSSTTPGSASAPPASTTSHPLWEAACSWAPASSPSLRQCSAWRARCRPFACRSATRRPRARREPPAAAGRRRFRARRACGRRCGRTAGRGLTGALALALRARPHSTARRPRARRERPPPAAPRARRLHLNAARGRLPERWVRSTEFDRACNI
jgi:hypothetical protein